jgi:DNA-binding transcriptional LysR family regulator
MLSQFLATRLTIRHLRTIIAVGETGSLVGAARNLNLTQPSVTKALKEVEQLLEVQLFERANRGVVATVFGQSLLRHAKLILVQLGHAANELTDLKDGTGGRVVVGTFLTASAHLLPSAIIDLHRQRPNLTIAIVEGTNELLIPALSLGEIDFVVGRLPEHRQAKGLTQELLLRDEACLVVRASHPLAARPEITIEDLSHYPWILPRQETVLRDQINRALYDIGLEPPSHVIESLSLLTNRRLLLDADYISVWPRQVTFDDYEGGNIVILPLRLPTTTADIGIITRSGARLSPAAEALAQIIRNVARTHRAVAPSFHR